jgi:hypothetical protein
MPVFFHARQTLGTLLVLAAIGFATPLWAQKDAGAIVGLVRDPSGAVVTGAKVTVTDVDHGIQLTLSTNDQGQYTANALRIGRYSVSAEKEGFKKAMSGIVQVNIQDRVSVDLKLEPGMVTDTVTVTGENAQLDTETSELGNVVNSQSINALPLNGRNFMQLALLGTGIAVSEPGSRVETTYGFSANGARSLQNNFLLDGVDNNANLADVLNGSAYVIQPSVDAIAEFKVQTNSYSAEFGRGNGAIMNAVIKSGTNQLHGDLWEFLRNEKFDADDYFNNALLPTIITTTNPKGLDPQQPYKQNQFGFTLGGPIVKNKLFIFGDYEGIRMRHALPQISTVPSPDWINGNFSSLLNTSQTITALDSNGNPTNQIALDCNGNNTYAGEIFNSRLAQNNSSLNPNGYCGVPIGGYAAGGAAPNQVPTNIFPTGSTDALGQELANLFPAPNATVSNLLFAGNYVIDPKKTETENKFDVRVDQSINSRDNFFARFSYGKDTTFVPSSFNNALDGGAFADGYSTNTVQGLAASEIHTFRDNLINELRFGYNHLDSTRLNLNYNINESADLPIPFPGVPYQASDDSGGLPAITFSDGITGIGSSTFLPAIEHQHSYVVTDNLNWIHGRHAAKFGGELRFEQFTILEPAEPRGDMGFSGQYTDNPAGPGQGDGDAFASFLLGIPGSGAITSITPNIDYRRQIYSIYLNDDIKATSRITLNLGLRYEFFSTVKEAHNNQATFDFSTLSLVVPFSTSDAQLTPILASELSIQQTGSRGLISPDINNFAPRIGLAYQLSNKLVLRSGYGIFYGGQESGPFSNPSPGFNPPFMASEAFNAPCSVASANPASGQEDCSISSANNSNLPLNVLSQGFPSSSLTDPNSPSLYSLDPHLVTPYTQQWHLGLEYQLPADTVLEVSYAGSRGLKLYGFFNGNQAIPDPNPSDPMAPRRPAHEVTPGAPVGAACTIAAYNASIADSNPALYNCDQALDGYIDTLRSNTQSNYNSLQVRLEKRYTHGLQYQLSYTYAHALDNASSASLGSVNNGDFLDQRFPNANYGNADFDVRHRLVFSYIYDLPFGRGKMLAQNASGVVNQILGNWQLSGVFSDTTGNYYTATDVNNVSNADGGGTVGWEGSRPALVGNPNAKPCVPGTLFNTCAFADNTTTPGIIPAGTFGDAPRNDIKGPGTKEWDTSLVKQFPIGEQKHFEFRAELFNVLNHTNFLFEPFGAISVNPAALELGEAGANGKSIFGDPVAARNPRQIQLALKFYF